jgi:hypothetical protein
VPKRQQTAATLRITSQKSEGIDLLANLFFGATKMIVVAVVWKHWFVLGGRNYQQFVI